MDKYKIAINRMALDGKLPAGDPRWAEFTNSFENREIEPVEMLDAIYTGRSYSPWMNGGRSKANFVCAQHIGVDLDTEDERSAIATVEQNYFFRLYGGIIYETPSHRDSAPRCRVIMFLDQPIMTAEGYRVALQTVYQFFDGADPSCIDPSRFFFSNANLQNRPDGLYFADKVLPLAELRRYARLMMLRERQALQAQQAAYQNGQRSAPVAKTSYAAAALDKEIQTVARTGQGGRNHQLNRSAFNLGTLVGAGLLDEGSVSEKLVSAALTAGLPLSEVEKTLHSGLRAGIQNPRQVQ